MNTENSYETISNILIQKGIKPSLQRVKILQKMYGKKEHPTVNELYSVLLKDIPSLSKTTVYNTLNSFVDSGIVKAINLNTPEIRYDVDVSDHGHFTCTSCGKIIDIYPDMYNLAMKDSSEFTVESREIILTGICRECEEKMK